MQSALLLIDYINDIVGAPRYRDFLARHHTLEHLPRLIASLRQYGIPVIHARIGFSDDYRELPRASPLFASAAINGALRLSTPGCDFHPAALPLPGESVLLKRRVNAFHGTALDLLLRNMRCERLLIAGCATDLAVQSTARDAHDRDYRVTVLGGFCIAASDADHDDSLRLLARVAQVSREQGREAMSHAMA
ncbi:cysteine hydrolase family protein [Craterilacuibacter sp.]|uniref:cysteine hydrolase family protein n=1 Tax=Craterilacuibacter sp. TaxID=2870909 RepID=UPI003F2C4364